MPASPWLTTAAASAHLGVSRDFIRANARLLGGVYVGGNIGWRFRADDLEAGFRALPPRRRPGPKPKVVRHPKIARWPGTNPMTGLPYGVLPEPTVARAETKRQRPTG